MDYLTIEGVAPYDGRYEFDLRDRPFTVREWGWIKRHSGYLPRHPLRRVAGLGRGADGGVRAHQPRHGQARSARTTWRRSGNGSRTRPS